MLYDNNWSLRSLRELLHMVGTQVGCFWMLSTSQEGAGLSLITRQLEDDLEEGYRPTLREVGASNKNMMEVAPQSKSMGRFGSKFVIKKKTKQE